MTKEQLQEIIERVFNEYFAVAYGAADMLWPKLQNKLLQEMGDKLTASQPTVPSEELIRAKCRENAQLILDHRDKLLMVDGVEDLLYSLVRGLFPNPEWAIKRMQETKK